MVNGASVTSTRRSGVYTIGAACLLILLTGVAGSPDAQTRPEVAADPGMVKGAATAAVTIVEYSDYQ